MKGAIDAPPDWVSKVPRPLDTTSRRTYTSPVIQSDSLKVGTTRYGFKIYLTLLCLKCFFIICMG